MIDPLAPRDWRRDAWIDTLHRRLEALVTSLKQQPGALALLGLGSTGLRGDRMDEYSDLDFFVIVQEDAREDFLRSTDWVRAAAPVVYDFENSPHGRKVLFRDGIFAEYAVFTELELGTVVEPSMRVIWSRDPTRDWGEVRTGPLPCSWGHERENFHLNEALTNLYVGLLRDRRGERLTALRFIQVYAVDRVLAMQALREAPGTGTTRDPFGLDRRAEEWAGEVPLASFCPGYEYNVVAARALLDWLVTHGTPSPVMVKAVQALLAEPDTGE